MIKIQKRIDGDLLYRSNQGFCLRSAPPGAECMVGSSASGSKTRKQLNHLNLCQRHRFARFVRLLDGQDD